MKCPYCGYTDTKVSDSRSNKKQTYVKRRRVCEECNRKFTTHEKVVDLTLTVEKNDGTYQDFDREKIYKSISKSLVKRNYKREEIEELIEDIERDILTKYGGVIKSEKLGETIMEYLLKLDEVAYIRFSSVYNKFENLDSFVEIINKIKEIKG